MKKKIFNPKISIIMVIHNEESAIIKSVKSILNQNFDKFELLILDNNSIDKTKFFLRCMSNKDSRIKIFYSKKNLGLTKGLNYLLKRTKSDVIARIDGDDFWNINKLRLQYKFFRGTNTNIVGTNAYYVDKYKIYSSSNLPLLDKNIRKKMIFSNPFIHSSMMFNKRHLKSYDPKYSKCQDYDAWLKLSLNRRLSFKNIYRQLTFYSLTKPLSFNSVLIDLKIRLKHLKHLGFFELIISTFYIFCSIFILFYKLMAKKK